MLKKSQPAAKVALVTGASRRIGAAIARSLHENGMNVMIHYHTHALEAKTLAASFNTVRPGSAEVYQANLLQIKEMKLLIRAIIKTWKKIDILVNNASCFFKTKIDKINEPHWNKLIDTNLKAPFFLSQLAFPYLAAQQGCIINIADIHATRPMPDYSAYCISKAGLLMLTKTLARELAPDVRVNAISPGTIIWPEAENALANKLKNKLIHRTALQRLGNPKEIAKAVLFLALNADYITGQEIIVDGGRALYT